MVTSTNVLFCLSNTSTLKNIKLQIPAPIDVLFEEILLWVIWEGRDKLLRLYGCVKGPGYSGASQPFRQFSQMATFGTATKWSSIAWWSSLLDLYCFN